MTATESEMEQAKQGDITVAGTKLSGLHDDLNGEDVEVLGFATIFTIGEFLEVPANFLEAQVDQEGLNEKYLPNRPTPKKAYTRACNRLFWGREGHGKFGRYRVETKKVNTALYTVQAEYYDEDAEEFRDTGALGNLSYDYDKQQLIASQRTVDDDEVDLWENVAQLARNRFDEMLETYTGGDLRGMVRSVIDEKFSVGLRNAGAVYFVPANQSEDLRKVSKVVDSCNTFKKPGRPPAQVAMLEVIDSKDKREFVEARVQSELNEEVEKALSSAADKIDEEGEFTDEVQSQIEESLEKVLGETANVAQQYNALLRADMEVEKIVKNLKNEFRQEVSEIATEIVEEQN